jgi:transcriptional regulator with XRE-family HTH domain
MTTTTPRRRATTVRLRIADLRATKGWTLDRLASESDVSKSTLIRLEAERTTRVDLDVIARLAHAFDCAPGYLLVEVPAPPPFTPRRKRS